MPAQRSPLPADLTARRRPTPAPDCTHAVATLTSPPHSASATAVRTAPCATVISATAKLSGKAEPMPPITASMPSSAGPNRILVPTPSIRPSRPTNGRALIVCWPVCAPKPKAVCILPPRCRGCAMPTTSNLCATRPPTRTLIAAMSSTSASTRGPIGQQAAPLSARKCDKSLFTRAIWDATSTPPTGSPSVANKLTAAMQKACGATTTAALPTTPNAPNARM